MVLLTSHATPHIRWYFRTKALSGTIKEVNALGKQQNLRESSFSTNDFMHFSTEENRLTKQSTLLSMLITIKVNAHKMQQKTLFARFSCTSVSQGGGVQ